MPGDTVLPNDPVQGLRDQINIIEDELQGESFEYVKVLMNPGEFEFFKTWIHDLEITREPAEQSKDAQLRAEGKWTDTDDAIVESAKRYGTDDDGEDQVMAFRAGAAWQREHITLQANDDALKRGMLVCPTCNDHHDEESVCRACADLEVTLARHREVTGMALARLRSALLKRGVNVTLDHAQSILDYAINGDGVG